MSGAENVGEPGRVAFSASCWPPAPFDLADGVPGSDVALRAFDDPCGLLPRAFKYGQQIGLGGVKVMCGGQRHAWAFARSEDWYLSAMSSSARWM